MPGGLVALLDDVAPIAKVAAASARRCRRRGGQGGDQGGGRGDRRCRGDARYVTGLSPARELPIIWKITKGSLRNKLLFLLPAALVLSAFPPWAITPLLMLGGAFLCYEGAEKVIEALAAHRPYRGSGEITDPHEFEKAQVGGAIRTDLILSAEIMAIALAEVARDGRSCAAGGDARGGRGRDHRASMARSR